MRLRVALAVAAVAYAAGVVVGIAAPLRSVLDLLLSGAPGVMGMDPLSRALFIFVHNAVAAIVIYALSIIYVGLAAVAFNGYVLGLVAVYAVGEKGFTVPQFLAAILPHGVIEIPAFLLASAAGLVTLGETRRGGLPAAARAARLLVAALLLLAPAAFIESYVTPTVARALGAPLPGV